MYGVGWWVGARMLSLSRTSAQHWMWFCWVLSVSLALFTVPLEFATGWVIQARNLGLLVACMLVRRGVAHFLRQPESDREHLTIFGAVALLTALVPTGPDGWVVRTVVLNVALAWVLLRLALEQRNVVGQEFGRYTGWLLATSPILLGVLLLARSTLASSQAQLVGELHPSSTSALNLALLACVIVLSTAFQFTLLYMVMLRLVAKLRHLSRHDPLTGLLNRRAWTQALAAERQMQKRKPRPLGLLMVDIDHFKQLNDRLGHAAGDAALCAVGATLQSVARTTDVVARLGGEEFGLLLVDTDVQGASQAAERVRAAIARLPFTHEDRELPMTVSVGAAVLTAELASRTTADAMLSLADEALYQAKAAGRNRVVVQSPPGDPLVRVV